MPTSFGKLDTAPSMEVNFEQFVKFCDNHLGNKKELLKLVKKRFDECDPEFKSSHNFSDTMHNTAAKIRQDQGNFFVYLRDFLNVLKENKLETPSDDEPRLANKKRHLSYSSDSHVSKRIRKDSSESGSDEKFRTKSTVDHIKEVEDRELNRKIEESVAKKNHPVDEDEGSNKDEPGEELKHGDQDVSESEIKENGSHVKSDGFQDLSENTENSQDKEMTGSEIKEIESTDSKMRCDLDEEVELANINDASVNDKVTNSESGRHDDNNGRLHGTGKTYEDENIDDKSCEKSETEEVSIFYCESDKENVKTGKMMIVSDDGDERESSRKRSKNVQEDMVTEEEDANKVTVTQSDDSNDGQFTKYNGDEVSGDDNADERLKDLQHEDTICFDKSAKEDYDKHEKSAKRRRVESSESEETSSKSTSSDDDDPFYKENARKTRERVKQKYVLSVGKKNKARKSLSLKEQSKRNKSPARTSPKDKSPIRSKKQNNNDIQRSPSRKQGAGKSPVVMVISDSESESDVDLSIEKFDELRVKKGALDASEVRKTPKKSPLRSHNNRSPVSPHVPVHPVKVLLERSPKLDNIAQEISDSDTVSGVSADVCKNFFKTSIPKLGLSSDLNTNLENEHKLNRNFDRSGLSKDASEGNTDTDSEMTHLKDKQIKEKKRAVLITEEYYPKDNSISSDRKSDNEMNTKKSSEKKTSSNDQRANKQDKEDKNSIFKKESPGISKDRNRETVGTSKERTEESPGISQEKSGINGQDEADGDDRQAKKGSSRQIKKLERLLEQIRDQIEKVRLRELDLEDLDSEVSDYVLEDKLQRKFVKVWDKLCKLHNATTMTGRPSERYFRYEGTRYPDVNRKIEKFINRKKIFPDFHDVHNLILKVNKDRRLHLRSREIDDLAREAFTDVGNQLQQRRQKDYLATLDTSVNLHSTYDDPALYDPELKKRLEHNKKTAKTKMDQVVEKYASLQYKVGDKTDDEDDDEEEEEAEEEAAAEEAEFDQLLKSTVLNSNSEDEEDDVETKDLITPMLDLGKVKEPSWKTLDLVVKDGKTIIDMPPARNHPISDPKEKHFCDFLNLIGVKDVPQSEHGKSPTDVDNVIQIETDDEDEKEEEKTKTMMTEDPQNVVNSCGASVEGSRKKDIKNLDQISADDFTSEHSITIVTDDEEEDEDVADQSFVIRVSSPRHISRQDHEDLGSATLTTCEVKEAVSTVITPSDKGSIVNKDLDNTLEEEIIMSDRIDVDSVAFSVSAEKDAAHVVDSSCKQDVNVTNTADITGEQQGQTNVVDNVSGHNTTGEEGLLSSSAEFEIEIIDLSCESKDTEEPNKSSTETIGDSHLKPLVRAHKKPKHWDPQRSISRSQTNKDNTKPKFEWKVDQVCFLEDENQFKPVFQTSSKSLTGYNHLDSRKDSKCLKSSQKSQVGFTNSQHLTTKNLRTAKLGESVSANRFDKGHTIDSPEVICIDTDCNTNVSTNKPYRQSTKTKDRSEEKSRICLVKDASLDKTMLKCESRKSDDSEVVVITLDDEITSQPESTGNVEENENDGSLTKTDQSLNETDESSGKNDEAFTETDESSTKTDKSSTQRDESSTKTDKSSTKRDETSSKSDKSLTQSSKRDNSVLPLSSLDVKNRLNDKCESKGEALCSSENLTDKCESKGKALCSSENLVIDITEKEHNGLEIPEALTVEELVHDKTMTSTIRDQLNSFFNKDKSESVKTKLDQELEHVNDTNSESEIKVIDDLKDSQLNENETIDHGNLMEDESDQYSESSLVENTENDNEAVEVEEHDVYTDEDIECDSKVQRKDLDHLFEIGRDNKESSPEIFIATKVDMTSFSMFDETEEGIQEEYDEDVEEEEEEEVSEEMVEEEMHGDPQEVSEEMEEEEMHEDPQEVLEEMAEQEMHEDPQEVEEEMHEDPQEVSEEMEEEEMHEDPQANDYYQESQSTGYRSTVVTSTDGWEEFPSQELGSLDPNTDTEDAGVEAACEVKKHEELYVDTVTDAQQTDSSEDAPAVIAEDSLDSVKLCEDVNEAACNKNLGLDTVSYCDEEACFPNKGSEKDSQQKSNGVFKSGTEILCESEWYNANRSQGPQDGVNAILEPNGENCIEVTGALVDGLESSVAKESKIGVIVCCEDDVADIPVSESQLTTGSVYMDCDEIVDSVYENGPVLPESCTTDKVGEKPEGDNKDTIKNNIVIEDKSFKSEQDIAHEETVNKIAEENLQDGDMLNKCNLSNSDIKENSDLEEIRNNSSRSGASDDNTNSKKCSTELQCAIDESTFNAEKTQSTITKGKKNTELDNEVQETSEPGVNVKDTEEFLDISGEEWGTNISSDSSSGNTTSIDTGSASNYFNNYLVVKRNVKNPEIKKKLRELEKVIQKKQRVKKPAGQNDNSDRKLPPLSDEMYGTIASYVEPEMSATITGATAIDEPVIILSDSD